MYTSAKDAEKALLAKSLPKERSDLELESATIAIHSKVALRCVWEFRICFFFLSFFPYYDYDQFF
jgi:hypothetical protein